MKKRLFVSLAAALAFSTVTVQQVTAQNSSPYWSIYGNTNATGSQKLGTYNTYPLRIITNNSTRIYISPSAGYVGVGTTSPSARLHVNAASGTSPLKVAINGSYKLYIASNGYVGINTTTPAYNLQVNGNASISSGLRVGNGGSYGYNSSGPGIYGSGSTNGVEGHQTGSGNGVYGISNTGNGVYGYSSYGYGLYAVNGSGNWGAVTIGGVGGAYGSGGTYGVYGNSSNSAYGVYGISSTTYSSNGSTGVYGKAYYGVQGIGTYGVYGNGTYGLYGVSNTSSGYGSVAYGGAYGSYGYGSQDGVYGYTPGGSGSDPNYPAGVYGYNAGTGYGVGGYGTSGSGIYGYSANYVGVYGTTANSSSYAGYFVGKVYSSGGYTSSDRNLKKDIADVSNAMDIINKLQPKSYTFRQDGNYKLMNLPTGKHFGLIAQDVEQLLPNLVSESKFDTKMAQPSAGGISDPTKPKTAEQAKASEVISFKALNYTELIPIIVKGMQEQAELIKQQQQQINDLKDQLSRLSGNSNILTSAGTLSQNSPNPVRTTTRIAYSVPNNGRAQLLFTDALGKTIKVLSLNNSGYVNFNAAGLSSGMYNYSLMVDGKLVETKKMEIVR